MHYLVGGPARSFITTQRDVDHQFENFQTVIAHATATGNDPLTTEQIDRIQKAVKAALEFYRGLLERNQIEENPSCAFGAGQMVGSITANAMTKAAETGGVIGAAAGYLSNHLWIVWLGGGAAVACLAILRGSRFGLPTRERSLRPNPHREPRRGRRRPAGRA